MRNVLQINAPAALLALAGSAGGAGWEAPMALAASLSNDRPCRSLTGCSVGPAPAWRTHSCVPRRHSCRRPASLADASRKVSTRHVLVP